MKNYKQLNSIQRGQIQAFLFAGYGKKEIAKAIGVHYSTVYREIKRNGNKRSYNAETAEQKNRQRWQRMHRRRKYKGELRQLVRKYLLEDWSPQQIVGYLQRHTSWKLSHETIYKELRDDKANNGELLQHTRHKLKHRHRPVTEHYTIPDRRDISERPGEANGKRFGDWEADLIVGPENKGAILTLTERLTNYSIATKLNGKNADEVAKAMIRELLPYKETLKTITTDNGKEFSKHTQVTKRLGVLVYFARPFHAWEKGAVENFNGLLRQYIPKRQDIRNVTEKEVKAYQYRINSRPRAKLNFDTPKFVFFKNVNKFASVT